jgi:hypothetical protein
MSELVLGEGVDGGGPCLNLALDGVDGVAEVLGDHGGHGGTDCGGDHLPTLLVGGWGLFAGLGNGRHRSGLKIYLL